MALSARKRRLRKRLDPRFQRQARQRQLDREAQARIQDAIHRLASIEQSQTVREAIEHIQRTLAERLKGYVGQSFTKDTEEVAVSILRNLHRRP